MLMVRALAEEKIVAPLLGGGTLDSKFLVKLESVVSIVFGGGRRLIDQFDDEIILCVWSVGWL